MKKVFKYNTYSSENFRHIPILNFENIFFQYFTKDLTIKHNIYQSSNSPKHTIYIFSII